MTGGTRRGTDRLDKASAPRAPRASHEPLHRAAAELERARLAHAGGDSAGARAAVRTARSIVDACPDPRFDDRLRATENAIRFAPLDDLDLPPGARKLTEREQAVLAPINAAAAA